MIRSLAILSGLWWALTIAVSVQAQPLDSVGLLGPETYLEWVRLYHPLAKQAALLDRESAAELRLAKGNFDPKAYAEVDQKSFDGKNYYTIGEGGIKLPTSFGAELKAAYNWTNGVFLNPENSLPAGGQAVAGIRISLLQGLLIDERRTALQQARILSDLNAAERRRLVNELLLEAAKSYWNWALAEAGAEVYRQALRVAEQRFEGVRESYFRGYKPAIDTLESLIQVQNRQYDLNLALVELENARLALSNYLWMPDETPAVLSAALRAPLPEDWLVPAATGLPELPANWTDEQPDLQLYRFKLAQLQVERRWRAEQLKPRLDLEYNLLADGFDFGGPDPNDGALQTLFAQNYKWGLQFSFPLFLRKELGKLQLTDLKLAQTAYQLSQKQLEVNNKVSAYRNLLANTRDQIELYAEVSANYARLLEAENEKFRIGESSIFLLNSREQKLLEAQLKLIKLQADYRKTLAALRWASGQS